MSKVDKNAIQNAEQVIERFGGIRPMASKMNVPVTTVQGWKKRNVIPGKRYEDIVGAAREHNIDLKGLLKSGAANENVITNMSAKAPIDQNLSAQKPKRTEQSLRKAPTTGHNEEAPQGASVNADMTKAIRQMENRAVTKSTIINVSLLVIAMVAAVVLLWPRAQQVEQDSQKIAELEADVQIIKQQGNANRSLIPGNISERLNELQRQTDQIRSQVGVAVMRAEEVSNDVLSQNAGNFEQRLTKLERHVNELGFQSPQFSSMLERVQGLQQTVTGRSTLDAAMAELNKIMGATQNSPQGFTQTLNEARNSNPVLGQTFEGVPADDLKAAALLLGLSQFRNSLNRGNEPFQNDLSILMGLISEDNAELRSSMEKLAPHAESGVLTPDGLSQEFRSLTGEIVVASLKGEDVSVQEKAKARFNELLQVQKDGELVTGTETQATVVRTQSLLEQGDLAAAIAEMKSLDGPAAQAALPWLKNAQATLDAQQAKQTVSRAIYNMQTLGGGTLIRNEETGINVLQPGLGR